MVVALCERLGRKVRIIHNDRCIWDFTPEKKQWGEMVVLSVWGDHAFFYKDKLGAQTIRMAPVSAIPECKLACRVDYERTPYGEMEPWDIESGNKTFRADRIGEVIEQLREAKRHFKVKYRTANLIASVRAGNQRIRSMPASAELLNSVAEALAKRMPFVYCGEAEGGFATRFMEQVLSKRRPSHVNREAVLARQKGICGKCGDHLEEFEVHHERSLRDGGGSNIENLKALCISCHALETERQGYASRHSFWSELSPDATEMWNETPKPAQLLWGLAARRMSSAWMFEHVDPRLYWKLASPSLGQQTTLSPMWWRDSRSTTTSGSNGASCRTSRQTWRPTMVNTSIAPGR